MVIVLALSLIAANPSPIDDVQALRREVDELRAEVQALRFALSEISRLERQQADIIDRTLRGRAEPPPSSPPPSEPIGKRAQAPALPKSRAKSGEKSGEKEGGAISGSAKV